MKRSLIVSLVAALTLVGAACVTYSLDGLSPSTQVYAMQREFNDLYLPAINRYAGQDFCDATATPPVIVSCADAKTVITLNNVAQETGSAITVAQAAVRDVEVACSGTSPASPVCTDNTKLLALSVTALRAVLARVSTEYLAAGLDK